MRIPWLDLSEVRAFATHFVEDLCRARSGGIARGDKPEQIAKRFEKLLEKAALFEREHRLNFYKKAQLVAQVRRGLSDKAWQPADVEFIAQRLIVDRLRKGATPTTNSNRPP